MNEQELQSEILSTDDAKLREMCGSLKRISAPKNFNMRVKARIAAHNPQAQRKPLFAFLKVAAPLGLAVAFLGAVVTSNFYMADEMLNPQITASYAVTPKSSESLPLSNETNTSVFAQINSSNANFESNAPRTVSVNMNQALASTSRSGIGKILTPQKNNLTNNDGGGSLTESVSQPKVITADNANKNLAAKMPSITNSENMSSVVGQRFSSAGINAVSSGSGWRVQSVDENSLAERSEIKPNDVIEAVDGVNFSKLKDFKINVGTKLSVVRENIRMVITLK